MQLFQKTVWHLASAVRSKLPPESVLHPADLLQKSIEEIAYEVGYNNYNYYSNSFHRLYGISPTGYRKLAINGQPLPDPFDALLCEE